jgi:hypothetical protein
VSLGALLVAMVMVPVAIAYACNPQAQIRLDQRSYEPGATISVAGSFFTNADVTVAGPVNTQVVPTSGGGFTTTLTAPDAPGDYTVTASRATGGFAPASFSVVAPAPAPTPTPPPAAAPSAPVQAPAPAAQTFPSVGSTSPERGFRQPLILPIEGGSAPEQPSSEGRGEQETARPETNAAPVQTAPSGQQVFASPAPALAPTFAAPTFRAPTFEAPAATAPAFAAPTFAAPAATRQERASGRSESGSRSRSTAGESSGAAAAQAPADQAALSDLFSAYEPGRTASLMDGATGMSDGGAGSGLGLGIGLLAFGLAALVAGLTAVEVRRRRLA